MGLATNATGHPLTGGKGAFHHTWVNQGANRVAGTARLRRPTAAALAARGQDGEADGSGSETRGLFA